MTAPVYAGHHLSKTFGGVRALDDVDLTIHPGEVQALVGANGAGKSTLMKILVGAERPTSGELSLPEGEVTLGSVADAARRGIALVAQELTLFPELDVLQNLFMLREPRTLGSLVSRRQMRGRAGEVMETVGLRVPVHRKVGALSLAEQQLVEIARALLLEPRILFLDEPTSALQAQDTARLLDVIRRLREDGVALVYVSHFLEDVLSIADTVTVLRNGEVVVARRPRGEMTLSGTVREMLGADLRSSPRKTVTSTAQRSGPVLQLTDVTLAPDIGPLDLAAHAGEVVGLAGLEGAGPRVVLEAVFGIHRPRSGRIVLDGRRAPHPSSMAAAARAGIALVPADRKVSGAMLDKPVYENIVIVSAGPLRRMGIILRRGRMLRSAEDWMARLHVKAPSASAATGDLSGGNQQKVVLAKWLHADAHVILLDDPTRGVDVGAKVEIYAIIDEAARAGKLVLLSSSDMGELCELCDRVYVFVQGRVAVELRREELSEHVLTEAINTPVPQELPSHHAPAQQEMTP